MSFPNRSFRSDSRGVSMIEVLVAIVIIAIGLLGIAALQGSALQNNYLSIQYTQAALLAQNLSERMRANREGVLQDDYDIAAGVTPNSPATDCALANCSPTELATWDLDRFDTELRAINASKQVNAPVALASGTFSVRCSDAPCTDNSPRVITVYWDTERSDAKEYDCDPDSGDSLQCFRLIHIP